MKFAKAIALYPLTGLILACCGLQAALADDGADEKMPVVQSLELDRYLGKWFEIARIDHRFQKGCVNSTAEYQLRKDGDINVINRCAIKGKKKDKKAVGRAWITDTETQSKLRVQFVLTKFKLKMFSGRYWVLALGEDYDYVLVGEPSREYLWILSRTPTLDSSITKSLLQKAEALGYDLKSVIFNKDLVKKTDLQR